MIGGVRVDEDRERTKAEAMAIRAQYLAGDITYGETKARLAGYIQLFNRVSEEIAAKYGQKPQKIRVGEFLRSWLIR